MTPKQSNAEPWARYVPDATAPWDRRRVVHLHRRAGFAASRRELDRDLSDGPEAAVDRVLAGTSRMTAAPADFETMARTIGDAAQASGSVDRLQAWWLYRMLLSADPLAERLALMWHNHFATSNRKVQDLVLLREQNEVFRRHARGPFGELLSAAVKHPAMLIWLDADSNRAGHPNENLARELMELFTLGVGNYSEADVREAARSLTGWSVGGKQFRFASQRHDSAEIALFGRREPMTGDDLLKTLVEHPATAHRVAWRLSSVFFGEGALDSDEHDQLALGLREHDLNVGWAVETILRSRKFFEERNLRTRVLGPVEFVVGAVHALELSQPPPSTLLLAEWVSRMGQELFAPPNVGGWPEGRSWLGSRSVVARSNFAAALVEGRLWNSPSRPDLWRRLQLDAAVGRLQEAVAPLAALWWGEPLNDVMNDALASAASHPPEEQLAAALVALLSHPEAQLG